MANVGTLSATVAGTAGLQLSALMLPVETVGAQPVTRADAVAPGLEQVSVRPV